MASAREPRAIPAGMECDRVNIHTVWLNEEFRDPDYTRGLPSIETKVEELPPLGRGKFENANERRLDDFFHEYEMKRGERIRLPREEREYVTSNDRMQQVIREIRRAMDENGSDTFPCGIDQEKEVATLQISMAINDKLGRNPPFESNVTFQVRTAKKGMPNVSSGPLGEMVSFLSDPRLVFFSVGAPEDLKKIFKELGISDDVLKRVRFVELQQIYTFIFNLLWSPEDACEYLGANHAQDKFVKEFWSVLGNAGLLTITKLAFPGKTMAKRLRWRDGNNNFDCHKGPIGPELEEYASLDSWLHLHCVLELCEKKMGIPFQYFVRVYGRYQGELECNTLPQILRVMAGSGDIGLLSPTQRRVKRHVDRFIDSDFRDHFLWNQFEILFKRSKKEWIKAETNRDGAGKSYFVEWRETPSEVWRSRPTRERVMELRRCRQQRKSVFSAASVVIHDDDDERPWALGMEATIAQDDDFWEGPNKDLVGTEDIDSSEYEDDYSDEGEINGENVIGESKTESMVSLSVVVRNGERSCTTTDTNNSPLQLSAYSPTRPTSPSPPRNVDVQHQPPLSYARYASEPEQPPCAERQPTPPPPSPPPRMIQGPMREIQPIAGSYLATVVDGLVRKERRVRVSDRLLSLKTRNTPRMIEDTLSVIKGFYEKVTDPDRRIKLVKECKKLFDGDEEGQHEFMLRVITSNVLERGRIYAANVLCCKNVSPFILLDGLFEKINDQQMSVMAAQFSRDDVLDLVKFVASHFHEPDVMFDKIREQECFQPYDRLDKPTYFDPVRVRKFLVQVLDVAHLPQPDEMRMITIKLTVQSLISSFRKGYLETEDFMAICTDLVGTWDRMWELIYFFLERQSGTLAALIAPLAKIDPPVVQNAFVPSCRKPFNSALHSLPHCAYTIVKSAKEAVMFELDLSNATQYLVDIFTTTTRRDMYGKSGLVTFVTKTGIFFVLPSFYPDVNSSITNVLKADRHRVLTIRWSVDRRHFRDTFGFIPKTVINIPSFARRENGEMVSFDEVCEKVTGGPFCQRASFFSDNALPSDPAFDHRAMRGCAGFDFINEEKKLGEPRVVSAEPGLLTQSRLRALDPTGESPRRKKKKSATRTADDVDDRQHRRGRSRERKGKKEKEREVEYVPREDSATRKKRERWEEERRRDASMEARGWRFY